MNANLFLTVIFVLGLIDAAFGCNGYKANILKMENCAGADAIISADADFTVKLTKKCELVPVGCVANKAFATAKAKYTLKKDKMVIKEEEVDLCSAVDGANQEAKSFMKVFSMPEKCPVAEEKICANDHKFDVSKYKNMMSLAKGSFELTAEVTHDTGKSCLHLELEITK
ncbi:uncharacterized protein LOC129915210 [Episyrphus balteatus]|uniref:uncharacterized protein LOC129915210 n=1 Tax=Episyrphus balteatus TaxID=286459 RepID=UPI00248645F8|nr:uncharacterized protein LOC129915210 [Episyrphus balteatus]